MTNPDPNILSAKDFHDVRAEITSQGVKGLIAINGGGAVALLAFLQAIWSQDAELARYVLVGIASFSVGVFLAGFVNFFRYHSSFNFQSGKTGWYKFFRNTTFFFQYASLVCFGVGMLVVVVGAWKLLAVTRGA